MGRGSRGCGGKWCWRWAWQTRYAARGEAACRGSGRGVRSVMGVEQDATHHLSSSATLGPPSWSTTALVSSISLLVPRLVRYWYSSAERDSVRERGEQWDGGGGRAVGGLMRSAYSSRTASRTPT